MLRFQLAGLALAAIVSVGCATLNVSSHVERGIDFTQFVTYGWSTPDALPTGDPRLDNNPFFRDYLMGAVEKEFARRGYVRASDDHPQLLVHYHANVSQRFEVEGQYPPNYPYCIPNCEPVLSEFEQGTLVIDVLEAQTGRLVWRGWAQENISGIIDDQDALRTHVTRSVAKMFEMFPNGTSRADTAR